MVSEEHKGKTFHLAFVLGPQDTGDVRDEDFYGVIDAAYEAGVTRVTFFLEEGSDLLSSLKSSLEPYVKKKKSLSFEVDLKCVVGGSSGAEMVLSVCSPVDGRVEMIGVLKEVVGDALEVGGEVTATGVSQHARFANLPDPDLMAFFGGRRTLSKLGVWRGAYSEFAFLDVPWHSFSRQDLLRLLKDFDLRERRFGAISN